MLKCPLGGLFYVVAGGVNSVIRAWASWASISSTATSAAAAAACAVWSVVRVALAPSNFCCAAATYTLDRHQNEKGLNYTVLIHAHNVVVTLKRIACSKASAKSRASPFTDSLRLLYWHLFLLRL